MEVDLTLLQFIDSRFVAKNFGHSQIVALGVSKPIEPCVSTFLLFDGDFSGMQHDLIAEFECAAATVHDEF